MLKRKIMLISHDATRTGGPILFINLADVLLNNGYIIDFIVKYDGPLETEFTKRGNTILAHRYPLSIKEKILNKFKLFPFFLLDDVDFDKYDFIISNTITNGDLLLKIRKRFSGQIISYIHELKMATKFYTNPEKLKCLIESTNAFAVPSESVKDHLINNLSIHPKDIHFLNYYIPNIRLNRTLNKEGKKEFVIGALGTTDWRKSPDLFIQTAIILFKKNCDINITFKWQGDHDSNLELERLNYDIEKSGMTNKIKFIEGSFNIENFFTSIDLFFLTSREDPFPLVVLEAANYGIPTICFEGTGGACEFVSSSKGGAIIPYLELETASKKIVEYYQNPDELAQAGENAKKHLGKFYQDQNFILKQFNLILNAKN